MIRDSSRARAAFAAAAVFVASSCSAPSVARIDLPTATSARDAFRRLPGPHAAAHVATLTDNASAWATRWALLRKAHQIDLGTFIFDGDVLGRALLGLLLLRAEEGARVRLLVDGRGSLGLATPLVGRDDLEEVANAGVDVRVYNPPWRPALTGLFALDAVPASAGSHNKILVLDDVIAIVGGRNITALSFLSPAEHPLAVQDADVVVEGEGVRAIDDAFVRDFGAPDNDRVRGDRVNLRSSRDELVLLARAMDAWLSDEPRTADEDASSVLLGQALRQLGHAIDPTTYARVRAGLATLVGWRSLRGRFRAAGRREPGTMAGTMATTMADVAIVSVPSRAMRHADEPNPPLRAWLLAIAGARRSVVIESPSFIVNPALLLALQAASARGVEITVLTNGPLSSDSRIPQALFVDSWPELLARVPRLRLFVAPRPPMQHGKRAVFDDALAFTGTFNVDPFSMQMNSEIIVATWSPALADSIRGELAARRMGMLEYRIARQPDGTARRHPSGTTHAGDVVVEFGPRDHVGADELARIARVKALLLAVRSSYDFDVVIW
jgi:phosphatidylserine/phosphatidylglycerophosphate/cardiolipin synthase-like enzyme